MLSLAPLVILMDLHYPEGDVVTGTLGYSDGLEADSPGRTSVPRGGTQGAVRSS